MRYFRSLFLLSVGSLAFLLCSVAARADSIPTLNATSASYSDLHGGPAQWSVSGASFGFGGVGYGPVVYGYGNPGQSLGQTGTEGSIDFAGFRGPEFNSGFVTLNGVTHSVVPLGAAAAVFSPNDIVVPYGRTPYSVHLLP